MTFRAASTLSALVFAGLSLGLVAAPGLFAALFGLDPSVGAEVMARRAGVIFAGLTVIFAALRPLADAALIRGVALGGLVMMVGMIGLGLIEWGLGRVGPGILVAVLAEVVLALIYLRLVRAPR